MNPLLAMLGIDPEEFVTLAHTVADGVQSVQKLLHELLHRQIRMEDRIDALVAIVVEERRGSSEGKSEAVARLL